MSDWPYIALIGEYMDQGCPNDLAVELANLVMVGQFEKANRQLEKFLAEPEPDEDFQIEVWI